MTGYKSKRKAAQGKLAEPAQEPWCMKMNGCNTNCEDCPDEAALAQPAQEPVAWMSSDKAWMWSDYSKALAAVAHNPRLTLIPLYTKEKNNAA